MKSACVGVYQLLNYGLFISNTLWRYSRSRAAEFSDFSDNRGFLCPVLTVGWNSEGKEED